MQQTLRWVGLLMLLLAGPQAAFAAGARYLIITHDDFYGAIRPLAEWKHKKGLSTHVTKLSEISPPTREGIRDYVEAAYLTWVPRPEFLLLVGDIYHVPIGRTSPRTDNDYGDVAPRDTQIEIFVGRLPCSELQECSTMVARTLAYERTPCLGDDWFRRATTIQQDTSAWSGDTIHYQKQGVLFVCSLMVNQANFQPIDTFTRANPEHDSLDAIASLNSGRSFLLYTGEGLGASPDNWGDPFGVMPESDHLSNGLRAPVVLAWVCSNVQIPEQQSIGERWLSAGSASDLKGVVAFLGVSQSGEAPYRSPVARNFFRAIFDHDARELGRALEEGEDGGKNWAAPEFIDYGSAPALVLNGPTGDLRPWVAYRQSGTDIVRAIRLAPDDWERQTVFDGTPSLYAGEPSLAAAALSVIDPMAFVVYSVTAVNPDEYCVNLNTFSQFWISPPELVYNSGPVVSRNPSIAVTPWDILRVCWNLGDSIVYSTRVGMMTWQGPYPVSRSGYPPSQPASHPSIEAYGDQVLCVWRGPNEEGQFPGDVWKSQRPLWLPPWRWDDPENKSRTPNQESDFPEMTTDFAVIWHEQVPPDCANHDIWAHFLSDPDPRPIFQTPMMSIYPHVAGYWDPSIAVFHTSTVWTEQRWQNPPLYEVEFGDFRYIPSLTTDAGLYYSVSVGQDPAAPYCTNRDGYVCYTEYRTDFGRQRLRYTLPYLNPRNDYLLCAIIYREGQGDWTFDLLADSVSTGIKTARSGVPETVWVSVPRRAYSRDGRIICNLRRLTGEFVSVAALKLYQVEGSRPPRGGEQSSAALALGQLLLGQNTPNPFHASTLIRYVLPRPDAVSLEIVDVTGRLLRQIVNEPQPAGMYSVNWDGRDARGRMLPTGVCLCRLQVGSVSEIRRAVLVR